MICRSSFTILLFALCGTLCAGIPEQWQAYFFHHDNAVKRGKRVPIPVENGVVKLKDSTVSPVTVQAKDGAFDLDELCGRSADTAVLVGHISSETDRQTWLGVGCRMFAVRVNGEEVYDFTGKGLGNDYDPVTIRDHIFPVTLKKGDNEIQIETCRSSWKLDYCYGKNRKVEWRLVVQELTDYQPVKAELAHPEFLSRPDIGSVMITFITREAVPAGVDYRLRGTTKWQREWDLAGDCVLQERSRIHRIRLTGLKPDSDYEYRLVLLEPPAGLDGFKRPLWSRRPYREVLLPVRQFRSFGTAPDFRFFVLGDTQISLSEGCKSVEQRSVFMDKMRAMPEFRAADFVVHQGDVDSYEHDLEKSYFTNFFDGFYQPDLPLRKPFVYVRGNHEFCGLGAEAWPDFFTMPGEHAFYAFRRGEVMFIVLDCGDFIKNDNEAYNGPILKLEPLYERQTRWLEKLRQTPEFRNAKFRVVIAHVEPQIEKDIMSEKTRKMVAPLLADQTPQGLIQLWISGHVHKYWRVNRGSSDFIARRPIRKWALDTAPVTWVSVDAPKGNSFKPDFSYLSVTVGKDLITVSALDENGKEFDRFSVDPAGKVTELFQSPELQHFPLDRK